MKLEQNQISTFDLSTKNNKYTPKTDFSNTKVSEIVVFGVYKIVLGVRSKFDILFHSNFNKEQNPHSLKELIYILIVNFGIYWH